MKILCVIDSLGSGGAQRQLVNLAIGFKELGHDVSFLVYHSHDFYGKLLSEANIPVKTIFEFNYLRRLFKIRAYIRSGGYDTVLSFLDGPNFICEVAGFPWRNWTLIVGERSADPNILKSLKLKTFRWFHLFADFVVANSYKNLSMVREINPLLSKNKCKVIYNTVDFEKWKPSNNFKIRDNGKLSLIVVSNHQELKNAKGLVNALNSLPTEYKNQITVHWYGRRDTNELKKAYLETCQLVEIFNLHEVITFFDANPSIHEIVPKYDALGLFSFYEGMPNSICEGMASGKPIISTDVSDIKLMVVNGFNGFIANDCSSEKIKESLIKLLDCSDDDLKRLGNNASQSALQLFQKDKIISEYLNLMNKKI